MALVEFIKPSYSAVKSINGQIGNVNLTAEDIGAATEEYVIKAIGEIPQPDMSDYATIGDVEDATRGLATEAYVNQKVAEAAVGGEVNLDDYLRKDELGAEIDVAVRERNLTNEDRAREIANEVCDERGTGSGGDSEVVCWEGTLNASGECNITLSEEELVKLLEVGNRDALISITNDDDGSEYNFTSYASYDDYSAEIEFQGVDGATDGLLNYLYLYTDNSMLDFMLSNETKTAYIRISLAADRDYYTKEEVDEKIAGIGGGEVNYDEVWNETERRLENDFRYNYVCGRLGTEQDGEWHEIFDGNLTEFAQRRRDCGDRFVLYMEGTPAKIDVEDSYWNEEFGEEIPWKLHINWEDGDHIHYSWEIRDIMGIYHYQCNGYGPVEYGVSEGRVNELIEEGLANAGGGSVAVDGESIRQNEDGTIYTGLKFKEHEKKYLGQPIIYTSAWGGDFKNGSATGQCAFAFGTAVQASKLNSVAFGSNTQANYDNQMVLGTGNMSDEGLLIVGNGTAINRSNAFVLRNSGAGIFAGELYCEGMGEDAKRVATQEYVDEAVANAGGGSGSCSEWQWMEKDPASWDNYIYATDYSHIRIVCSFGGYDNRTTTFSISTGANRTFADENGYTYYETLTYNGVIYSIPIANNGEYLSIPSSVAAVGVTGDSCSINMIGYYYWG